MGSLNRLALHVRGGRYDVESWKWACTVASQSLSGLRILITARGPGRLEHFEMQIDPPPDKVLVTNFATPADCLQAVQRTLKRKLGTGRSVENHDFTEYDQDDEGRLAQKVWEATLGNANLVANAALLLLDRKTIAYNPADSLVHVLARGSADFHVPGLTVLMQQRIVCSLSVESQEVFKCASLMGLIFDHELLKCLPSGAKGWANAVQEALNADLVIYNAATSTYQFHHDSLVVAATAMLTQVPVSLVPSRN